MKLPGIIPSLQGFFLQTSLAIFELCNASVGVLCYTNVSLFPRLLFLITQWLNRAVFELCNCICRCFILYLFFLVPLWFFLISLSWERERFQLVYLSILSTHSKIRLSWFLAIKKRKRNKIQRNSTTYWATRIYTGACVQNLQAAQYKNVSW